MSELHYYVTLRLFLENKSFGPGPMALLQGVRETGSLQKSAERLGMAYSKAWKTIQSLEQEWGFALLESRAGGAKGGGSSLTAAGEELLERYCAMLADVEAGAEEAFQKYFGEKAQAGAKEET